jgi:hypothetical protein
VELTGSGKATHVKKTLYLFICFAISSFFLTARAQVSVVTSAPSTTNTLNWSVLGSAYTAVSNPFTATSAGGTTVTGTFAGTGGGQQIRQQGDGWDGNFSPNDYVLWSAGNGPLTLSFNQAVSLAGAQIQSDAYGAFNATIQAYDGATLLGTFTVTDGDSTSAGDGSAIFLGVQDLSGSLITSITFNISGTGLNNDFAIDTLDLVNAKSITPEPASIFLFGSGLLGIAFFARRVLVR